MRDSIKKSKKYLNLSGIPREIRNGVNWNLQIYIIITYYLLKPKLQNRINFHSLFQTLPLKSFPPENN